MAEPITRGSPLFREAQKVWTQSSDLKNRVMEILNSDQYSHLVETRNNCPSLKLDIPDLTKAEDLPLKLKRATVTIEANKNRDKITARFMVIADKSYTQPKKWDVVFDETDRVNLSCKTDTDRGRDSITKSRGKTEAYSANPIATRGYQRDFQKNVLTDISAGLSDFLIILSFLPVE